MKTPVNGPALRQHLTYNWWKYILVTILAVFGVNLLYTVTTYRPPEEKKVDTYVYGLMDEVSFQAYVDSVHAEKMSDMEQIQVLMLSTDATYGPMQLSTYIAAGEGDLYMLPRDNFISLAGEGAFLPLEEDEELMKLFSDAGISLQSGWRRETESGETHLYGIPISKLPGLKRYVAVDNGFVSILVTCGNNDNCAFFLRTLCEDMLEDPDAAVSEAAEASAASETANPEAATGTAVPEAAETEYAAAETAAP